MTRYEEYLEDIDYEILGQDEEFYQYKYNSQSFKKKILMCEKLYVNYREGKTYAIWGENSKSMHLNWNIKNKDKWKECLNGCCNLHSLNVRDADELPKEILGLPNLRCLELCGCKLANIINDLFELIGLKVLILDRSDIDYLPEEIGKLCNLESLSLMSTGIVEVPKTIAKLQKLKYLGLNSTKIEQLPLEIYELAELEALYIGRTQIKELPAQITNLKELKTLAIWETPLTELPTYICELKNLEALYMARTRKIKELPKEIGKLNKLKELYLDETGLEVLPDSFEDLISLEELILSNTKIKKLPKIHKMPNLRRCELCKMTLERIPEEYIYTNMEINVNDWDMSRGILLKETKLLCQPISLFAHSKEFIHAYYEEEKIHLNEAKVVFLGDGEAGKSHIIRRVSKEGRIVKAVKYQATPGIDIVPKQCKIGDEQINLQLWDFGGQDILHSMHRFFLTDRTLYVIVVNARDNTQNERARYWLNNVKSFAEGCPVIIVLNKMDQNKSAGLNETSLKSDYPQIKEIIKMSALVDDKEKFDVLTEKIFETVKTFDSYAMEFPISWNTIKTTLAEMPNNYVIDQDYRMICEKNGVTDVQIQNWLLEWFHDLGVSFNYRKRDVLLGAYMVLKPQWITNAIYIILFNAKPYATNGVININDIVCLLENPPKAVEDIKYSISEVPYILGVLRRFDICYQVDDKYEFMPMLCEEDECVNVNEFIKGNCLEYYMEYQYLPNNVLHKLMIRMRDDLQKDRIWLTGMLLKSRENHISAIVRIHEERLEIYVKSDNYNLVTPKEYLSQIREHLSKINKDLGLVATDTIIYKEDDLKTEIRYDDLLIYLKAGRKEYFSTTMRKEIPVKQILGTVETNIDHLQWLIENEDQLTEEQIRMILLRVSHASYADLENELVSCCCSLQGNYLERVEGDENDRNTYLKDLLQRSRKYIVHDQTLNGSSSKGKAAGELDLKVCINKNSGETPLSVVEAMNLACIKKDYIKEHIEKVYSYDTWGAKYNYLIIYAQTKNFNNFCKRYEKYLQSFQFPLEVEKTLEERELDTITEIRLYDTSLKRNGKSTILTHIIVNMGEE